MKKYNKYLVGLGTILLGTQLAFLLMHGEVSAKAADRLESFVCSELIGGASLHGPSSIRLWNCETPTIRCVITEGGSISCVNN